MTDRGSLIQSRCEACELEAARLAYAADLGASEWAAFIDRVPPCEGCRQVAVLLGNGAGSSLIQALRAQCREADCDDDRRIQAAVYACPYCDHLPLAVVSEKEWTDWRQEPTGGTWVCPNCRRAQCELCKREATRHFWGNVSSNQDGGATFTCREDMLLCPAHTSGYKRRSWRYLFNDESIADWLARGVWTTPLYLRKHVAYLTSHCCDGARHSFALGAGHGCRCGKFADLNALHAAQDWDDDDPSVRKSLARTAGHGW